MNAYDSFLAEPTETFTFSDEEKTSEITNFNKFLLLFWKYIFREWRDCTSKILAISSPTIFITFLIVLRTVVNVEERPEIKFDTISFEDSWFSMCQLYTERRDHLAMELLSNNIISLEDSINNFQYSVYIPQLILCYAPIDVAFSNIMNLAVKELNFVDLIAFNTCAEMRESMMNNYYLAGVCFDDEILRMEPTDAKYKIGIYPNQLNFSLVFPSELRQYKDTYIGSNWDTNNIFDIVRKLEHRIGVDIDGGYVGYVREGFIPIQDAISASYLYLLWNRTKFVEVQLRRFPYRKRDYDVLLSSIDLTLPLAIIMGFAYPVLNLSKYIIEERLNGIKFTMKYMDIPYWVQASASYLTGFLNIFAASFMLTIALKIQWNDGFGIYSKSSFTVLVLLMIAYSLATVSFCNMFLSFASRNKSIHILLLLTWILTYLPYMRKKKDFTDEFSSILIAYIFSNSAMANALSNIHTFEMHSKGLQWEHLFSATIVKLHITTGNAILILFAQSFIYMSIAVYMDNIDIFGKFKALIYRRQHMNDSRPSSYRESQVMSGHRLETEVIEIDTVFKKLTIEIQDVHKYFNKNIVLKKITMNMFEGDITVIMGHNSSGKTTLLSTIGGIIKPTKGNIIINGIDIYKHSKLGLKGIGISICHIKLLSNLSVKEQLTFACAIKGNTIEETQTEVDKYLNAMQLTDKSNILTQYLTTGTKQYLEVCCALIGKSKVVLLDDPSLGMDMVARKLLWQLLLDEKQGRTIVLGTQSTDEADALADRIAILSDGQLQCCGSSYLLKNLYCTGYRLVLTIGPHCNIDELTNVLQKHIPQILPEYILGNEVSYILEERYLEHFYKLLDELHNDLHKLNLISFSICELSLREVFMQRGTENPSYGEHRRHIQIMSGISIHEREQQHFLDLYNYERLKGFKLWCSQWHAMFLKCYAFQKHHPITTLIQFVAPFVIPFLSIILTEINIEQYDLQPITYDLDPYINSITIISSTRDISAPIENILHMYLANLFWTSAPHTYENTSYENLESYIIRRQEEQPDYFNHVYLNAATFSNEMITAWFNNYALHTAPLSLNMVYNAIAQSYDQNAKITVSLDPLPHRREDSATLETVWNGESIGSFLARNIALCFTIFWPSRLYFFNKERTSGFKLLQFIAGLTDSTYWMYLFITNMIFLCAESLVIVLINRIFLNVYFKGVEIILWYLAIIVISGISVISLSYLITRYVEDFRNAYGFIVIFLLFNIICHCSHVEFFYQELKDPEFSTSDSIYRIMMRLLPFYSLIRSLEKIFRIASIKKICNDKTIYTISKYLEHCNIKPNCCENLNIFNMNWGVCNELICLSVSILIFCILIYIFEYHGYKCKRKGTDIQRAAAKSHYELQHMDANSVNVENNVILEKLKIQQMVVGDYLVSPLVCDGISLYKKDKGIIQQLYLLLSRYDCCGFIGINGSGKTVLLKLIVGDLKISEGRIIFKGLNLKQNKYEIFKTIGYISDTNMFLMEYTGKEILVILLLLRGVPKENINKTIDVLSKILNLTPYLNKPIKNVSTGFKKRISFATSLLGQTNLLCLDNPTLGVDHAGTRIIWNLICKLQQNGKAILFTTNVGWECKILCNRIGILSNGHLSALGTLQSLNEVQYDGFLLQLKVKDIAHHIVSKFRTNRNQFFSIQSFMESEYPNSYVKGIWGNVIIYVIPNDGTIKLSEIFKNIHRNCFPLKIEDFHLFSNSISMLFTKMTDTRKNF